MRIALLAALLLSACSNEAAAPPTPDLGLGMEPGDFAANDRDALCIYGVGKVQRAGFISYGKDNQNCSASGKVGGTKGEWFLQPAGDAGCRIPLTVTANGITVGAGSPACSYYCAPGQQFAGKSFTRVPFAKAKAKDLAGDDLC